MRTPRTIICASPLCERPAWSLGFCGQCIKAIRENHPEEIARLESLTLEERRHENYLTKHGLPLPSWEYEPTEEQTEQLIRTYGNISKRTVKVGRH